MVWKQTTKLGIARAEGTKANNQRCVYIVAIYEPPGNIPNAFATNVVKGDFDQKYCKKKNQWNQWRDRNGNQMVKVSPLAANGVANAPSQTSGLNIKILKKKYFVHS